MLRQGPLPAVAHGAIEYVAAVVLIAAPFVLAVEDDLGVAASIVLGLVILALTATSELPTGLTKAISPAVHVTADVVIALLLVAAPFILGFRADEGRLTALFIVLGVAHLLITIATRFPDPASRR